MSSAQTPKNVKIVTVTPALAHKLLQKQAKNRPVSRAKVAEYAQAIIDKQWRLNGEGIMLDKDQRILNGQHRLHAIVQAKKPIKTYMFYNMPADMFSTYDQHKSRTAGDILHIDGTRDANTVATAARYIMAYIANEPVMIRTKIPVYKIRAFVLATPTINDSVNAIRQIKGISQVMTKSMASACHYVFSRKNKHMATEFFEHLATGASLPPNHPILKLRDRILYLKSMRTRLSVEDTFKLTLKAWNIYRSGRTIQRLKVTAAEKFPRAK